MQMENDTNMYAPWHHDNHGLGCYVNAGVDANCLVFEQERCLLLSRSKILSRNNINASFLNKNLNDANIILLQEHCECSGSLQTACPCIEWPHLNCMDVSVPPKNTREQAITPHSLHF